MSYRFLPYVRRGLADKIPTVDTLGTTIAAHGTFGVRVTLNTGDAAQVDLRLHGPGDVIGVDPRGIVRIDPPRSARNVAPDQFAAIEFDAPDFAWMFTPAAGGSNDRLRPWLVLVVVERQPGVAIVVRRDRPLPQLTIEAPAVPGDELPDLSESWAWAHAHVVEDGAPASVPIHLRDKAALNVSRLLCPRRLKSGRDYVAALVPAFEVGRLAGLGQTVPAGTTTGPAWGASGSVGASVTLPTYYHWDFHTGPAGDFESLARQLVSRPVPDTVGRRKMYIGAAHPALPSLAADAGGVIDLEGALRAPEAGSGPTLGPEHDDYIAKLSQIVDGPGHHVLEGASPDAESVAPPIYGGRHVKQDAVTSSPHLWLRELNTDPQHRAAGGLGTEVVRLNQERFVDAAWQQVGDVLAANALLDRARFLQRIADRIHARHLVPLPDAALLSLTSVVHVRIPRAGHSLAKEISFSTLPAGTLGPTFRRMVAPRSTVLTRALRQGSSNLGTGVQVKVVEELAAGERRFNLLATTPDGLVSSRLIGRFGGSPTGEVGGEIGAIGTAPAALVRQLKTVAADLAGKPVVSQVKLRPDLAKTGVLLPRQLASITKITHHPSVTGTATSGGATSTVAGLSESILTGSRDHPEALGFALSVVRSGVEVRVLELEPVTATVTSRALTSSGGSARVEEVARLESVGTAGVVNTAALRDIVAASVPGTFTTPATGRGAASVVTIPGTPGRPRPPINVPPMKLLTTPTPTLRQLAQTQKPPGPAIDPPIKIEKVVRAYVTAFDLQRAALEVSATSIIPAAKTISLASTGVLLREAINPHLVIEARARLAVRVNAAALRDGLAGTLRQRAPLDPVMASPLLPEALYRPLAEADPDRFLPGIGEIPDDTITLLETNPRFVEAFMVGANHEMNRELLWRGYPTDRRGTPFRRFWDRVDGKEDLGPINEFRPNALLGTNSGADLRGSLVLLVRGQLLRRYPETVMYAAPARPDKSFDPTPSVIEDPIFWGRIAPDVTFVGFDLNREEVEPDPGWYFVLAEQPTAPRFGLDVSGASALPGNWSDLHWGHVGADPGDHLSITGSGLNGRNVPLISGGSVRSTFGRNSADMAAITFQRPFRAVVHSSEVLDGQDGHGLAALRPILARATILRPITLPDGGG
ncbi:hypothetical protein [Kocuria kalidii]|uniref:hypothetical protein n=1 Tax=Kocuria kalidii TaxID=3376283 RepID=UPI0037A9E71C